MDQEQPHHRPISGWDVPRFVGLRTFMRLPHVADPAGTDFFVVGIPFDTGASFRVGARFGPAHMREHSLLLRPYHLEHGVDIFEACSGIDVGDLMVVPGYTEDSYARIQEQFGALIATGSIPLALGGDHSIALPELRALHARHGPLGLLHFDAHTDTWDRYWGHEHAHGTMFRRAVEEGLIDPHRAVQVGLRGPATGPEDLDFAREAGFRFVRAPQIHRDGVDSAIGRIREVIGTGPIFLSFDIDCMDPAYAPGTGTPEVGGLTPPQVLDMLRGLAGIDFVAFDLVEVLPTYDPAGITGLLAANLVWEFMALVAMRKKTNWWFHEFHEPAKPAATMQGIEEFDLSREQSQAQAGEPEEDQEPI